MEYPSSESGIKRGPRPIKSRRDEGYTFFGLMIILAILGVALLAVGEVWHFAMKREKERELLFVGDQYRRAIKSFHDNTPVSNRQHAYPLALEELLKDPRYPTTQRYLRRLFPDPVSGKPEWGLLLNPGGGIIGIHSLSEDAPAKLGGFRLADREFEGKSAYSEWHFKFVPPQGAGGEAAVH